MIRKVRDYFKRKDREFEVLNAKLDLIKKTLEPESSLALMRNMLGSIDLSDVDTKEEMSENERREYCAVISGVFPRLERDIKIFLQHQLEFSANEAGDWGQVLFGRGTFNGIDLLLEHWRTAHNEHLERIKGQKDFEKHSPIGELEE